MGIRALEAAILSGAKKALNNSRLRQKDIMEWSSGPIEHHDGEVTVHVPDPGVYVAVKKEHDKRKPAAINAEAVREAK
jgi:hypothetical protein